MKWLDKLKPTNALEIADELLEPMEGYPAPTQLEQRAADALRRQHQIILTLEAAQAQVADRLPGVGETMPLYTAEALAAARVQALEEAALMAEGHYGDGHRLAEEIRALIDTNLTTGEIK